MDPFQLVVQDDAGKSHFDARHMHHHSHSTRSRNVKCRNRAPRGRRRQSRKHKCNLLMTNRTSYSHTQSCRHTRRHHICTLHPPSWRVSSGNRIHAPETDPRLQRKSEVSPHHCHLPATLLLQLLPRSLLWSWHPKGATKSSDSATPCPANRNS